MNSKIKKLPGSKIELRVTLSLEEFKPYIKNETEHALREVHIQGFRKGNAPRDLALSHINHDEVFRVAAEHAVRESFVKIVQEQGWHVLEEPKIEVDPEVKDSLSYGAEFAVMPEAELPNYKKLAKKVFGSRKEIKVEEKDVQDALDFLAKSRGERVKVGREAKSGDIVELRYSVFSPDRSTVYFENKAEKIVLGREDLLPGFDEKVIGKKVGEEVVFNTTTPKDYEDGRVQDRAVEITAKIEAVLEKKVPEINDEFAKTIGSFENLEAMKKSVADGLREEKASHEDERLRAELMEQLVRETKVDLPEVLVSDMFESLVEDTKRYVASHGRNWDEYLKAQNKTEEQIAEDLKKQAKDRVISNLVIYQIAKTEDQKPTDEEVELEAQKISGQFAGQKVDPQRLLNYTYSVLQSKKVFDYLESLAK